MTVSLPASDDSDKTVIGASLRPPTSPDAPPATTSDSEQIALPPGTRLAEFEIIGLIGIGGFGIVYLAHDHSLDRQVALKEYMPSAMAYRTQGVSVTVKSKKQADTFAAGLRSFVNEARLLAQFNHPSLVKVYRFWEANGTAYMVMPFYQGLTLKQTLQEMPTAPDEAWLKALLQPVLNALQILHRENCFHRDIAPDNILMLTDGQPVLLDFGAARQVIGDFDKTLTVILKPGYAPIEQYADTPGMRQGPWTDIYALAAVVQLAITGKPPKTSVLRMMDADVQTLEATCAGRYSPAFLRGLDKALALRPDQRPQSVEELRTLLFDAGHNPVAAPAPAHPQPSPRPAKPTVSTVVNAPATPVLADKPKRRGLLVATGVAVVVGLGTAAVLLLQPASPPKASAAAAATGSASPAGPVAAAVPAPTVPAPRDTAPMFMPTPVAPTAAAAPPASTPTEALNHLFALRDVNQAVTVTLDTSRVRIGKDKLKFSVQSAQSGYLYILMVGTDMAPVHLLFPNELDRKNQISAGKEISLPRSGWAMTAGGPPGTDHFVALVSATPRDFKGLGLKKDGPFAAFSQEAVNQATRDRPGVAALAGQAVCKPADACNPAYGAAQFSVEETR